jgi:hypothetical protein
MTRVVRRIFVGNDVLGDIPQSGAPWNTRDGVWAKAAWPLRTMRYKQGSSVAANLRLTCCGRWRTDWE